MSKQTEADSAAEKKPQSYDCIIIGAGHNGLAAGLVLARNGRRVLVLEKNNYVGGMGGTREILKGCRKIWTFLDGLIRDKGFPEKL